VLPRELKPTKTHCKQSDLGAIRPERFRPSTVGPGAARQEKVPCNGSVPFSIKKTGCGVGPERREAPTDPVNATQHRLPRLPVFCENGREYCTPAEGSRTGRVGDRAKNPAREISAQKFSRPNRRPRGCPPDFGQRFRLPGKRTDPGPRPEIAGALTCAQICAHHRTLPSATDGYATRSKPLKSCAHAQFVAFGRSPSMLMISRAASPPEQ